MLLSAIVADKSNYVMSTSHLEIDRHPDLAVDGVISTGLEFWEPYGASNDVWLQVMQPTNNINNLDHEIFYVGLFHAKKMDAFNQDKNILE